MTTTSLERKNRVLALLVNIQTRVHRRVAKIVHEDIINHQKDRRVAQSVPLGNTHEQKKDK
jgi:hypothetical protein